MQLSELLKIVVYIVKKKKYNKTNIQKLSSVLSFIQNGEFRKRRWGTMCFTDPRACVKRRETYVRWEKELAVFQQLIRFSPWFENLWNPSFARTGWCCGVSCKSKKGGGRERETSNIESYAREWGNGEWKREKPMIGGDRKAWKIFLKLNYRWVTHNLLVLSRLVGDREREREGRIRREDTFWRNQW